METAPSLLGETIAMSPEPAGPFTELPRAEWRDAFFALAESVREAVVRDMSRAALERFIDRLDPDEVTEVLGYADASPSDVAKPQDQRR